MLLMMNIKSELARDDGDQNSHKTAKHDVLPASTSLQTERCGDINDKCFGWKMM